MLAQNWRISSPPAPTAEGSRRVRYFGRLQHDKAALEDERRSGGALASGLCPGWPAAPRRGALRAAAPARSPSSAPSPSTTPTAPAVPQRVLGVDYGTATTGLALGRNGFCNALKALPTPRTSKMSDVARQVLEVAAAQGCEAVVVGIPVQPGGNIVKPHTDSPMGRRCRSLAHTLALLGKEAGVSVYLYNEKSTTRAVVKGMGRNWQERLTHQEKQAKGVDAEAAAMLLRLYFGNPRLAVRINPRPNVVVVEREEEAAGAKVDSAKGQEAGHGLEEGEGARPDGSAGGVQSR